ncbi:MAG TPA: phosphatase PAP2 family protein [Vicinamibacterales bacterium]|nr:phosphatase PAP2 family protein [Vicinamibacterales bacterium]
MRRWRIGAWALAAHLVLAPCAFAQETPAAGAGHEGESGDASAQPQPPVVTPPVPVDQPFKRLFPNFWHDLTHFPSVDTAVVLGIGGVLSAAASQYDEKWTTHASAGGEDPAYTVGGAFGSGFVQFGIAVGAYAGGRLAHHDKTAHIGADLIRAQLLSGALTQSIKLVAQRERPTEGSATHSNANSFPSGHASATWTTATVLWRHLGWKVGAPASLLAAFTSASRLQQNDHYMSDVLFGAAIGIASGRTITVGHGERHFVVAPSPVAGGAAITMSFVGWQ